MKRLRVIGMIAILAFIPLLIGCATSYPVGSLYTELKLPVDAEYAPTAASKWGQAECISVLNLVATGDASIATAMKNGDITKVHYVDWEVENILGIIGKYRVTVYGE